jgi:hypothetical protein
LTIIYDALIAYDSPVEYDGTGLPTGYLFTPPNVKVEPTFLPDSTELEKSLWAHFENRYRGVNVWILSSGEIVQSDPTPENSNTDMSSVYPWDVNNAAAPYVTSVFVPALPAPQVATVTTVSHPVYPVAFFSGGSTHSVTSAQATLLADYTAYGIGYADRLT